MEALTPVVSSQIHAVGFEPATGTLAIQFKSKAGPGNVYHYANFTQEKFDAFKGAESIGSHFGKFIKGHPDHPHTKILADEQKAADAA